MNVFIVYAHHEPKSFNGALRDAAVDTFERRGHVVQVSDLYAMSFRAAATGADFHGRLDPLCLKYQAEQRHAQECGTLAIDIVEEQEKLRWCDLLILQFPLWWFSLPAILKGWVDRVFTMGFAYGGGAWYDNGGLRGRRAMLSLTTGGAEAAYGPNGINGDIERVLYPIQHGVLYFVGFEVLRPFIAWSPANRSAADREAMLINFRERLRYLDEENAIEFPRLEDYDEDLQLRRRDS